MIYEKLKNISLSFLYSKAIEIKNNDPKFIALSMAGALLFELYGRKWMSKRLLNKDNMPFILNQSIDSSSQLNFQMKILMLGESLYNLRNIEGIQNILRKLENENIESVIAELESGRLLYHRGVFFKYVSSSQIKRNDFDIYILDGSNKIFCETKCKLNTTIFSENSFHNSLHKAKQQLPKDYPAIILIKIPDTWGKYEYKLRNVAKDLVLKTERPIGIICWYEIWQKIDNIFTLNLTTGFEEHNVKSQIINANLLPFLPAKPNSMHWVRFERYASGYI